MLRNPTNQSQILKGRKYQSSLRIMTLPLGAEDMQKEHGWRALTENLASKLSSDKNDVINKYWTFPLSTSIIANDIATDLFKVFDGRNASFHIEYQSDRTKEVSDVLLTELNVNRWIEKEAKKVLLYAPNTIAVVDKDDNGDPFLLAIDNDRLYAYEFVKGSDSVFEYIAFVHSTGEANGSKWTRYSVYCDGFYRVITKVNNNYLEDFANPHTLGYCPARFFYNKPLISTDTFNRSIPFSCVRGAMFQWTIFDLFEKYQDHFAGFQIIQYAESYCHIDGCDQNGTISHDRILNEDGNVTAAAYTSSCPNCASKSLIAPGSAIGVVVSDVKEDQDARGVFGFIAPDITAVKYIGEKQKLLEQFIKENAVGASNAMNDSAMNETQILALVESKNKPLFEIKFNLENLDVWIKETAVKVTYEGAQIKATSNYGTEFYILTVDKIITLITAAKAAGAQSTYIEQLNKMLIVTEYKNDPLLIKKMLIAADLEPNAYDSQQEARDKFKEGMMTREDYYLKSNFTDLLNEFQRENGSIVTFGIELPYATKIQRIKNSLYYYISKKITEDEERQESDTEPTASSDSRA